MRAAPPLDCTRLEPREVPAAALFADLNPGVWGSYPQNLTASGPTLFFSAEVKLGNELYATDGTPAGTRLVKDIQPGRVGSNPTGLIAAGNGVVFFSADDGTGRTLWKSDGTAAGTVKVTGLPGGVVSSSGPAAGYLAVQAVGWKGELYFLARHPDTGGPMWAKTGGSGYTVLRDLSGEPGEPNSYYRPSFRVNGERMELLYRNNWGWQSVWQTDGTPAGTGVQQTDLFAYHPLTGSVTLEPGVEISPGRFVFAATGHSGRASVWVGSATWSGGRQLLKAFDAGADPTYLGPPVAVNGKAYFAPVKDRLRETPDMGLWVTDGTSDGTRKLALPSPAGVNPPRVVAASDGLALVLGAHPGGNQPETYYLTDGTDAGTFAVPRPAGTEAADWRLAGITPADAANPRGLLVFHETATDRAYRTDGTAAGTVMIDRTGLPPIPAELYPISPDHASTVSYGPARGVYFNGDVYYSGQTATSRPELWKWEVTDAATPTPAPRVKGTAVNDGSAQRSMVRTLTVTFDSAVSIDPAGVSITSSTGRAVAFTQQVGTVNGLTVLTLTFPGGTGGSIADGRYTLKVTAGAVSAADRTPMAGDYTFGFTRVYGDLSGDGVYDREARTLVRQLLGEEVGSPRYSAALDWDSNGKIDAADELAAVRNWGKAV